MLWFKPIDARVPIMAVAAEDAPKDVLQDPTAFIDKLFVVFIKKWPPTSHHPFGVVERMLGTIGEIEAETQALLADNNIITDDFSDKAKACLPVTVPACS
jgi:protein SSD1